MDFQRLFRKKGIDEIVAETSSSNYQELKRDLRLKDLIALAIAAIVGAGIFSTIGNAASNGGPAVSLLFVFTAIACSFSALCYAEFASRLPISGSAYTYAYASLGEFIAWIIGWDLLMEYSVGNIAVAISWSDYFTSFIQGFGFFIPEYLSIDYLSASRGFTEVTGLLSQGTPFNKISDSLQQAYLAWNNAPVIGSFRLIADIPAFLITVFITYLVYIGIRESKKANNYMVLLKIGIILLVIIAGAFYVNLGNWSPFAPNGISGVLKGVSAVFFAYIGFDAISTTAEECKNPKKDLPKAMIISLIVCTILYIAITLVLTGMVSFKYLSVGDPLAYVFQKHNLHYLSGIIGFGAIIAMASVLLVFQVGQPRIWMSMSRDGLLPKKFSAIHPKFKTPWFSTIITGIIVGVPSLFMNLTEVTDLTSIGTLFAFVVVCAGVLKLGIGKGSKKAAFIPYVNGKYVVPFILIVCMAFLLYKYPETLTRLFNFSGSWEESRHNIPYLIFIGLAVFIAFKTYQKEYSLIPVLGLLTNLYLMTELGYHNWLRFIIWLLIGLILYFTYGWRKSKLNTTR